MNRVAVLLLLLPVLLGAAPWEKPFSDPAATARAAAALSTEGGIRLLHDQVSWDVDEERRVHATYRLVYRLEDKDAVDSASSLSVTWTPWFQDPAQVRLRVVHPDGTSEDLNPSSLVEVVPSSQGSDVYTERRGLEGPLPRLQVGSIVEREVRYPAHSRFFDAGEVLTYDLRWEHPPPKRIVEIRAPRDLPLIVRSHGLGKEPRPRPQPGKRVLYRYELDRDEDPELFPYEPRREPRGPSVSFTTGRSWEEVAAVYRERSEAILAGADLTTLAREAAGEATEPHQRIANTVRWVQEHVRYTGLHMGEKALLPTAPDETLKRGFGDCKDQSLLVVGLLRAQGIEAHLALMNSGEYQDIDPELPGLRTLDHAIVRAGGDLDLWIDPTDTNAPAGQLRQSTEGRYALVIAPGTTALSTTTTPGATASSVNYSYTLHLPDEPGTGSVEVRIRPHGRPAAEYRDGWRGTTTERAQEYMGGVAEDSWLAESAADIRWSGSESTAEPFELDYRAVTSRRVKLEGDTATALLRVQDLLAELPKFLYPPEGAPSKRDRAAVVLHPHEIFIDSRVIAPDEFTLRDLPEAEERQVGPLSLQIEPEVTADGARVAMHLRLDRATLSSAELDELRAFVGEIDDRSWYSLTFEHAATAAAREGRYVDGLSLLRAQAAKRPQDALVPTRQSELLLAAGAVLAARQAAQRAVELDPESIRAWDALGEALTAGWDAEPHSRGWDRLGAIEARERRVALPRDGDALVSLAAVLEVGRDGELRTLGADLSRATDTLLAATEEGASTALYDLAVLHLIAMGEDAEADRVASEHAEHMDSKVRLDARLANSGLEAGLALAQEPAGSPRAARKLVGDSSLAFMSLARFDVFYPVAAGLADPNLSEEAQAWMGMFEGIASWDRDSLRDDPSPEAAGRRAMSWLLDPTADQRIEDLFTPQLIEGGYDAGLGYRTVPGERLERMRATVKRAMMGDTDEYVSGASILATLCGAGDWELEPITEDIALLRGNVPLSNPPTRVNYFLLSRRGGRWLVASEFGENIEDELRYRLLRGDLASTRALMSFMIGEVVDTAAAPEDPDFAPWQPDSDDANTRLFAANVACGNLHDTCGELLGNLPRGDGPVHEISRLLRLRWLISHGKRRAAERLAASLQDEIRPEYQEALGLTIQLLILGDAEGARKLAARLPEELAMDARIMLAAYLGGKDALLALLPDVAAEPAGQRSGFYNQIAWFALFHGATDEAVETAELSVRASNGQNSAAVHTLATAYAAAGRIEDARRIAGQILTDMEDPDYHLVLGMISEHLGALEAAREHYQRTQTGSIAGELDSAELARRRLEAIDEP